MRAREPMARADPGGSNFDQNKYGVGRDDVRTLRPGKALSSFTPNDSVVTVSENLACRSGRWRLLLVEPRPDRIDALTSKQLRLEGQNVLWATVFSQHIAIRQP